MKKKKFKILALDIATRTGWAISTLESGVENFSIKKGESSGMMQIKFRNFLYDICKNSKPDLIVYERPAGRFKASLIAAAKLISILEVFCEENKIELTSFTAKEIKVNASGKGNTGKSEMVNLANQFFKTTIIDDNHADALWLLDLAQERYC